MAFSAQEGRICARVPFEVAIFDEIQIAKNQASQTHKALRAIQARMRLVLTGTPIENRLRELKSLFDIALPSYMPPDAIFRDLFINPIEKQNDEEKKALSPNWSSRSFCGEKKAKCSPIFPKRSRRSPIAIYPESKKTLQRGRRSRCATQFTKELKDTDEADLLHPRLLPLS